MVAPLQRSLTVGYGQGVIAPAFQQRSQTIARSGIIIRQGVCVGGWGGVEREETELRKVDGMWDVVAGERVCELRIVPKMRDERTRSARGENE